MSPTHKLYPSTRAAILSAREVGRVSVPTARRELPPALERLGRQITTALACLRTARKAATAEPSGYHANQELMAELELDRLLVAWPTRRRV